MAKVKITQLPGYIEIDKQNDLLPIVDKLNTETKKITSDNLVLSYAATPEDIDRGISDEVYITPKALFDSTAYVSMSFMTVAYNGNKPLTTIDEAYQDVPNEMEGYTLVSWSAMCVDPSSSGDIVFSITHDGIDMFTSSITIDEWHTSSRTSTHPAVVNPFNQTLSAGKVIHFAVTSKGTGVTFAKVTLGFRNKAISGGGAGGGGDVYGPSSVVDDDIAVFNGTSGKVIKDSGVKITDIALGDVQGPVHSYDRDVPIFDGTTGKVIADSGITIDELKDHNQLDNLQGGDATSVEFYHLDYTNYEKVINGDFGGTGDYPNLIDILPDEDEETGKRYKTVQAAVDYLSSLLPLTVPWGIRIYGIVAEDLTVNTDLIQYVQIIGQNPPGSFGLDFNYGCGFAGTVTITDSPSSDGQIMFSNCTIAALVLSTPNGRYTRATLNNCSVASFTSDNSHCSLQATGPLMNCTDFSDGTLNYSNGILTGTITGGTITATNVFWGSDQPTGGTITVNNLLGFAGFWFMINTGTTWIIDGFKDNAAYNSIRIQTGASLELYNSDMDVEIANGGTLTTVNGTGLIEVANGGTLTTVNCTGSVTVDPGGTWNKTSSHNDHFLTFQGGTTDEYYHLTSEEHTTVQNTSGVNTGDQNDHNLLDNIQGGDSTSNEYYHLTSEEHDRINPATDTTLGVVKIGNGLTIEGDGTLNAVDPILNHNLLEGLQGGDSTSSEFYHLTEVEYNDLQQILYLGEWRT